MSKVGILTFQRAVNYGAVLQMYALQEAIKSFGDDVEVIDYYTPSVFDGYKVFRVKDITHPRILLSDFVNSFYKSNRNHNFNNFTKKYIRFSPKLLKRDLLSIENRYDQIIVGSDQVWNPRLTQDDSSYFLDFISDPNKKFSYAASFGISRWPATSNIAVQKLLRQFKSISVRETTGAEIVHSLIHNKVPVNVDLDPVFLLGKNRWMTFINKNTINEPYIFVYSVNNSPYLYSFVKQYAQKKRLRVVNLRYDIRLRHKETRIGKLVLDASPDKFLSLLYNASYVITDSFHATAFSIIFNKDMYVDVPSYNGSRISDLFDLLDIRGRILGKPIQRIDWNKVKGNLEKSVKSSRSYLNDIIQSSGKIRE